MGNVSENSSSGALNIVLMSCHQQLGIGFYFSKHFKTTGLKLFIVITAVAVLSNKIEFCVDRR